MFTTKTLFVVGAGASKELNLPTGDELKEQIAKKIDIYYEAGMNLSRGDSSIVRAIKHAIQNSENRDASPFYVAGRRIAASMPLAISIDNYLHTHQHDEKVGLMGKLGILKSILEAERNSSIYCQENGYQKIDFTRTPDTWHSTFCKMASEGVELNSIDNMFENVSFIIFNYDRCVEHYLSHALSNYFDINELDAQSIVSSMDIIHPYGQVGSLPWQNGSMKMNFGEECHHTKMLEAAGEIRTFTERVEDQVMMSNMHRNITAAEVIVYLGFSYGEMNMKLLKTHKNKAAKVYGTALGMSEPNIEISKKDIKVSLDGAIVRKESISLAAQTCNDFLNAYWKPILRG